jgi:hypothetical protein
MSKRFNEFIVQKEELFMLLEQKIKDNLENIDLLFKDFYTWLAGQYDIETGGFYYANSSKTSDEFKPDIESTAQATSIIANSHMENFIPNWMRKNVIKFFQERQDPKTGFFYDPQNDMRNVDRMVARAAGYSVNWLHILGAKPLYPVPGTNGLDSLPEHLKTPEKLVKWMEERPWDYSWMACDNISATSVYIYHLPQKEQKEYLDIIFNFLEKKQDPETGMWGDGRPYIKISGAFKLALFYNSFQKQMPRINTIYKTLLKTLREDISEDMCWTRNPIDLLLSLKPYLGEVPIEDISEIIEITYNNLKKYLKPDGGFSRHVDVSLDMPNNVILGKGLAEGDMNAGTQALRIRNYCYILSGNELKPLYQYMDGFKTHINSLNPSFTK